MKPDATPLDFFSLFFDDVVLKMLIGGTNSFASDVIVEKDRNGTLTPNSRWRNWRPLTMGKTKVVLTIIINTGVLHCPECAGYWKTSWKSYIPFFYDVLSMNRLEEILWMMLFPEVTTPIHHIDNVKTLLDTLVTKFQSIFYPRCEFSIDETMIGFKGQS